MTHSERDRSDGMHAVHVPEAEDHDDLVFLHEAARSLEVLDPIGALGKPGDRFLPQTEEKHGLSADEGGQGRDGDRCTQRKVSLVREKSGDRDDADLLEEGAREKHGQAIGRDE